jgi:hypothetical protein
MTDRIDDSPICTYKNFDIYQANVEFYDNEDDEESETFDVMFRNRDTGEEFWSRGWDHPYPVEVIEEHIYSVIDEMNK